MLMLIPMLMLIYIEGDPPASQMMGRRARQVFVVKFSINETQITIHLHFDYIGHFDHDLDDDDHDVVYHDAGTISQNLRKIKYDVASGRVLWDKRDRWRMN